MNRRVLLNGVFALAAISLMLLSACSPRNVVVVPKPVAGKTPNSTSPTSSGASAEHQMVTITEKGFSPAVVTITAGGAVVWSNKGQKDHGVDLSPAAPESKAIPSGDTAYHKFPKAGSYPYKDPLNPELTGKVIVR